MSFGVGMMRLTIIKRCRSCPSSLDTHAVHENTTHFFLPAFEEMSGFASFAFCWDTLLGHEPSGNIRILSGGWFYYSGFVMSNILFVGLVAALFLTRKIVRLRSVFSLVCFLQALSWLVLFTISGKPSQITAIKVGYYVWLIAYGLLVTAYLWKMMSNKSLEPTGFCVPVLPFGFSVLMVSPPVSLPLGPLRAL